MPVKHVHVAAAVIQGRDGRILIAKRKQNAHQGGLWEFPGGKVEPAEAVTRALVRELKEELAIAATEYHPLIRVHHRYPEVNVLLDVWLVTAFDGEPQGLEGQPIEWVTSTDLWQRPFPEANWPILKAACLPRRYVITPDPQPGKIATFMQALQQTLDSQPPALLQLRAHNLDDAEYRALANDLCMQARKQGWQVLLNRHPGMLDRVDADGLHLTAERLQQLTRQDVNGLAIVGASCHSPSELASAEQKGCTFATLSPVQATTSHPHQSPLGWDRFRELTENATIPVYALGGMTVESEQQAWQQGGQGIAAITAFWQGASGISGAD